VSLFIKVVNGIFFSLKERVCSFLLTNSFLMQFCYISSTLSSVSHHFAITIFWNDQAVSRETSNHAVFSNNRLFAV
jgi:hypothetical protein